MKKSEFKKLIKEVVEREVNKLDEYSYAEAIPGNPEIGKLINDYVEKFADLVEELVDDEPNYIVSQDDKTKIFLLLKQFSGELIMLWNKKTPTTSIKESSMSDFSLHFDAPVDAFIDDTIKIFQIYVLPKIQVAHRESAMKAFKNLLLRKVNDAVEDKLHI